MQSPFAVLGVDPGADEAAIHRAYRRRVKEVHPDQGGSTEQFQRLQTAYETLLDGEGGGNAPESTGKTGPGVRTTTVEYLDYEAVIDEGWSLTDDDLFETARSAGLSDTEYGRLTVGIEDPLLEAVERCGQSWPYSCRGGACANCAVAVRQGELSQPVNHILPEAAIDRGIRLSCVGTPITEQLQVVYNVKHLPAIADLRLPPRPADRRSTD